MVERSAQLGVNVAQVNPAGRQALRGKLIANEVHEVASGVHDAPEIRREAVGLG
jgi:hypothetical protein